ncbi:MAG: hypothetical protein QXO67_00410 [Candidatus Bathyarchaeia archaeon]
MERFKIIVGVLLAVGIIFGTFAQLASGTPFGFTWFTNMLWFAIGFPVLFCIGYIVFEAFLVAYFAATKEAEKLKEEE